MRVISGRFKGMALTTPKPGTRPTTDRTKEAIFSHLDSWGVLDDARVLDLFAGTGQLGIEALSRGAAHCDFIEHNGTAYSVVSKNVQTARVQDRASLHRVEARDFLAKAAAKKYSLIFLDPPYGGTILENALSGIERFDILSANGIIICESAVEDRFAHGFEVVRERRYGATMITVLRRQDGGTDE